MSCGIAERTASLAYTVFGLTTMAGSVLCGFLCRRPALKNALGSLCAVASLARYRIQSRITRLNPA